MKGKYSIVSSIAPEQEYMRLLFPRIFAFSGFTLCQTGLFFNHEEWELIIDSCPTQMFASQNAILTMPNETWLIILNNIVISVPDITSTIGLEGHAGETSATIIYGKIDAKFDFYHIKLKSKGKFFSNISVIIHCLSSLKLKRLTPQAGGDFTTEIIRFNCLFWGRNSRLVE